MFWITFRVLMPRGHTNWHFPQTIHLAISSARPFVSPRWISKLIFRGLKVVNRAAEQVAVQLPQPIHHLKDGSCCTTNSEIEKSLFSKSICRPFNMEYPQSFTVILLLIKLFKFIYFSLSHEIILMVAALASVSVSAIDRGSLQVPVIKIPGVLVSF